jgi:hypothetical protein
MNKDGIQLERMMKRKNKKGQSIEKQTNQSQIE